MRKKIHLTFFIAFFIAFLNAQQIGSWRLHFKYSVSNDLAYSDDKIISATNQSLLLYNIESKNLRELDKAIGLSDIGISNIAYSEKEETFVIVYNSTNIDLLTNNLEITNIPDIKNNNSSVSKNINNIYINESKAYFSTDIGIIVLDIKNQEIDNTYIIGDEGNPVKILDCLIFQDTLYALTKGEGVKTAPLNSDNLLDFESWNTNINSLPSGTIDFIETYENNLYVSANNIIYKKENNIWQTIYNNPSKKVISLKASEKLIAILKDENTLEFEFLKIGLIKIDTIVNENSLSPQLAVENKEGMFFVADKGWGLIDYDVNKVLEPYGKPFSSDIFSFSSRNNKVFASSGSMTYFVKAGHNNSGFYYFLDNRWKNVHKYNTQGLNNVSNFLFTKENPIDKNVYIATTTGLVMYDYDKALLYNSTNSNIEIQYQTGNTNTYVTGLDFDSKGNIWFVNSHTDYPLKVLTQEGEWYKYQLKAGGSDQFYKKVFIDSHDQIWVIALKKGAIVYPKISNFTDNLYNESLLLTSSNANLPHNYVNAIVEDKDGSIWLGTNEGIAIFDCPEDIFKENADCIQSRRIKSTLDEYTEYLFGTDEVIAIVVDGANRKWIGTNSGVWLISENGDKIILNFNTENSPLPSNEILSISIHEQTGEVFIGTTQGMVSYVSDATEPAENISNIKAFPNPVTPDYFGTISITGLVENSFIKITDISGTLIADGYALGGKYVWNGKDYNETRASSGVYLVFSSDNKSKNKAVAKIVFIN